jgi:hypothetical protein
MPITAINFLNGKSIAEGSRADDTAHNVARKPTDLELPPIKANTQ